jgi:hypothetical protein
MRPWGALAVELIGPFLGTVPSLFSGISTRDTGTSWCGAEEGQARAYHTARFLS